MKAQTLSQLICTLESANTEAKAILDPAISLLIAKQYNKDNKIGFLEAMSTAQDILECLQDDDGEELSEDDYEILIGNLQAGNEDFTIEVEGTGTEYRVIHEDSIEAIWKEELKSSAEECNPKLFKQAEGILRYMTFDWDAFYSDAHHDGYGHHFSSYDSSEENTTNHYIFRIN